MLSHIIDADHSALDSDNIVLRIWSESPFLSQHDNVSVVQSEVQKEMV